ncbi:MAG TPA: TetR/AcrR family transcriptional regulator [Dietzia timorensis]|uniref:TetR/AcrR family transcriptional regulator n=1 Tax=Dietzia timorensis TaxID=499555 RepID=A0A921JZH3_9ACTN|nr:TetR/AcrR family transcriptional regulator [Dietzia timorensis]HJE92057.1 TetR/AcrR family transcriptional regulator [Dietzia timorensis]
MVETPPRSTGGRRWRGVEPGDRKAERRLKLIESGLDLLAAEGPGAVTMRGVCRRAGLTERYFYESFDNRDRFLVQIFDLVVEDAEATLQEAVASMPPQPRDAIAHIASAFTDFLVDDPRRGEILFVQSVTSELYPHGRELIGRFTAIVGGLKDAFAEAGGTLGRNDELTARWDPLALFGGLAFVYQDWLLDPRGVSAEEISAYIGYLISLVARVDFTGPTE